MKTILWTAVLLIGVGTVAFPAGRWDGDDPGIEVFYSSLSPHGEWIAIEGASYAWRPAGVAHDWRPYWHGHWLWSEQGWYWWSPEPWAWAVYHYGRWHHDDYYGWVWIPGYDWAPAWVEWRWGDDFIGWAPLGPYAIYTPHFGIRYARHWVTPVVWWTFVGCHQFTHHEVWRHTEPFQHNERLVFGTRSFGSIRAPGGRRAGGPDRVFIEQRTNMRLPAVEVVDVDAERDQKVTRAGDRERIQVYRPAISRTVTPRAERGPEIVTRQRQVIRLDPRGMERLGPVQSDRPVMRSEPRGGTDRDAQPEWRSDQRPPRRVEIERPRRSEPREMPRPRESAPRSTPREGKREGR